MQFYYIKAQKYRGNIGEVVQKDLYVNIANISYIEFLTPDKALLHIVGEGSNSFVVTDVNSVSTLKSIAGFKNPTQ